MPFEIDNVTKKLNSGKWLYYLHFGKFRPKNSKSRRQSENTHGNEAL